MSICKNCVKIIIWCFFLWFPLEHDCKNFSPYEKTSTPPPSEITHYNRKSKSHSLDTLLHGRPGGGATVGGRPHGKSGFFFSLCKGPFILLCAPNRGSFCYFFSLGGPFFHVGALSVLFFPYGGPFLSLWGAFFLASPPPLTKISAGA